MAEAKKQGINFFNTFADVAHLDSIRLIFSQAPRRRFAVHQFDIGNAYVNADIDIPTEDAIDFLEAHPPNVTEPIIAKAMGYLRGTLGIGRVGITGYCFGGKSRAVN